MKALAVLTMKRAGAVTILACVIMSSCGPSPEEVAKAAVEEYASLVEAAATNEAGTVSPTDVPSPTLTFTPTASFTFTPTATLTVAPTATLTVTPTATAPSLQAVRDAVVYIEAEGSYVDPWEGTLWNVPGTGSGVVVHPSGIAITNNHVVQGAALLRVWAAGDTSPRNAKVLGASECSDIAVIDIDGDGFEYLDWYEGEIEAGMEIYAAGFPLGDPEFSLTRGIVTKARSPGDTPWASVSSTIRHDAFIQPGNSGGPLVDAFGRIAGINYASNFETGQSYALGKAEVLPLYEDILSGEQREGIGANVEALVIEDENVGVFVSSVNTGSAAHKVGLEAGDLIVTLENYVVGTDGTLRDYCDVLRSQLADKQLALGVYRYVSDEFLEGQIRGNELKSLVPPTPTATPTPLPTRTEPPPVPTATATPTPTGTRGPGPSLKADNITRGQIQDFIDSFFTGGG